MGGSGPNSPSMAGGSVRSGASFPSAAAVWGPAGAVLRLRGYYRWSPWGGHCAWSLPAGGVPPPPTKGTICPNACMRTPEYSSLLPKLFTPTDSTLEHPSPTRGGARMGLSELAALGIDLFVNLSASPYTTGKPIERRILIQESCREHGVPFVYVNQVGANTELIFDGDSQVQNARGEVLWPRPRRAAGCDRSRRRLVRLRRSGRPWASAARRAARARRPRG